MSKASGWLRSAEGFGNGRVAVGADVDVDCGCFEELGGPDNVEADLREEDEEDEEARGLRAADGRFANVFSTSTRAAANASRRSPWAVERATLPTEEEGVEEGRD